MSLFPSAPDVFVDRTGADAIASSDPNNAYDAIENIENFLGASGEAQSKSVTMVNLFRAMLNPIPALSYVNASSIGIPATQIALFNGDNFVFKRNAAVTTCSLALHLLNGSEAATTWYEVYIVGDGSNSAFTMGLLGEGTSAAAYATYYQKIGAVRNDGSSDILKFYQKGEIVTWDVPISLTTATSGNAWSGALSCTNAMPSMSTLAKLLVSWTPNAASNYCAVAIRPNGGTLINPTAAAPLQLSGTATLAGQLEIMTDSVQSIQYYTVSNGGAAGFNLMVDGYYLNI